MVSLYLFIYKVGGISLPVEFCLYEIKNLNNADKIPAKEFKSTIGIERNVKKQIMRKL